MTPYATIDDYAAILKPGRPITDELKARIEDLLEVAAEEIVDEMGGKDYLRHPATGTETWTMDGTGGRVLHFHEGLISIDTLEYSQDLGASYTPFEATDYTLRGDDYDSVQPIPAGEPYFHLMLGLNPVTRRSFPRGLNLIRVTGARGWPTPPRRLVEANAQRARQIAFGDQTYSGQIPGPENMNPYDYAQTLVSFRWPQVVWNFTHAQSRRFMACSL